MSVVLGQHDGEDSMRLQRIAWVFGTHGERWIVVVDLPQDPVTFEIEAPIVALAVRIVVSGEGVERSHLEERRKLELWAEVADAPGDHDAAVAGAMLAELVIELRDLGGRHSTKTLVGVR